MIWHQKIKPFIPKYASYDYVRVYDGNDQFIGWIRIYLDYRRVNDKIVKVSEKQLWKIDEQLNKTGKKY